MPKGQQFWKSRKTTRNIRENDPYWAKSCSLCGDKALYRRNKHVFCSFHKPVIMKLLKKDVQAFDDKWAYISKFIDRMGEYIGSSRPVRSKPGRSLPRW